MCGLESRTFTCKRRKVLITCTVVLCLLGTILVCVIFAKTGHLPPVKSTSCALRPDEEPLSKRLAFPGYKEAEVQAFLASIQEAVRNNDAKALSKMARYPFSLWGKVLVHNPKEFTASYARFVKPRWQKAVLDQKYEDLFVNWRGIMVNHGVIWFSGVYKDKASTEYEIKILTFNPWFY